MEVLEIAEARREAFRVSTANHPGGDKPIERLNREPGRVGVDATSRAKYIRQEE
jgi:hypothetical protein